MDTVWDYVVLGSGLGGLAAAAQIADQNKSVLVLEKGISLGGCASSFWKHGYLFETGATTLVGFEKNYPIFSLQNQLNFHFSVLPLEVPMVVHLADEQVVRYENQKEWLSEVVRVFGKKYRQILFWRFSFYLADRVWDLSYRYSYFPFCSFRDLFKTLTKFRISDLIPLFFSFIPTKVMMNLFGLGSDKKFKLFIDEQLLITNQSTSDAAPFSMAAAGLTYPNLKNYYVLGGMVQLSYDLLQKLKERSSESNIMYKQEVIQIQKIKKEDKLEHWEIKTKHREINSFYAKEIISNIPIWNLAELGVDVPKIKRYAKKMDQKIWGAFTMGIVIPIQPNDFPKSLHHQIHLQEKLPLGGGHSVFVSFSHPKDSVRSKAGEFVLSISTHIENPETWNRGADYREKKQILEKKILEALSETFLWFDPQNILAKHSATPVTWKTWTGRKFGRVGGIPSFYFQNPFGFIPQELDGLYLTGDTVYPGQGIPAVVLSGTQVALRIKQRKRD